MLKVVATVPAVVVMSPVKAGRRAAGKAPLVKSVALPLVATAVNPDT